MAFGAVEPRMIMCPVCKKKTKEPFFGIGFPGWLRLMDVVDDKTKENPIVCPECRSQLMEWLNGKAKMILNEKKK